MLHKGKIINPWAIGGSRLVLNNGGSGTTITVQNEGVDVTTALQVLNFVGTGVEALTGGTGTVTVYVPAPTFASHFNTTDGSTTGTVSESISRSSAHISDPTSEGNPFSTGGWAGSNQSASLNTSATFTTGGEVTGFGGNSTMTVTVYSADGSTVLQTVTTSAITGNGSYGSGNIAITISGYSTDTTRFKATPTIAVAIGTIFTNGGKEGGRYHVVISQTVDTTTDGSGTYTYTQSSVFLDTNQATPSIGGSTTVAETGGQIQTKHLSGVEYYITGSKFTIAITDIDNLNRNTSRTTSNIQITATNYGISTLNQSPFGTGSGNFTGWTNNYNTQNVGYSNNAAAISSSNFRYRGTGATASATPRDTWANGSASTSSGAAVLIDTFGTTSTDLVEDFDDENRRQTSNYNTGTTSGNWNSANALSSGDALVMGGQLIIPSQATLTSGASQTDFSLYKPNVGGVNPNYGALGSPANFYRTIVDTAGTSRSSFTITLTGTFVSNALTDLANNHLIIYIRRRASANGGNAGYNTPNFLTVSGAEYNFALFDDGVSNGQIREGSSSGGTINCTFGGKTCENGFFIQLQIVNTAIKIDRFSVTFY